MKKAEGLRAHLVAKVPHLKKEPQNLLVFIERGAIGCRLGGGLSFDYRYDINLVVLDFAAHADTLMIPLLAWIAVNEPALMQSPDTLEQVIKFEAEITDNDRADLSLTIPVRERVIVTPTEAGHLATHLGEPVLDDLGGASPWQIFLNGDPIVI
jgi:hypothetical protein